MPPTTLLRSDWDAAWRAHIEAAQAAQSDLFDAFAGLAAAADAALDAGGKLIFFGNGGSACDAMHLAAEFTIRFTVDRPAIAALALTADSAAITACGNDFGFEAIFARQIEALGRPGDLAIGISTSGRSANVLRGLAAARAGGLTTAALAGGDGGAMVDQVDHALIAPSGVTARIQEIHIAIGHQLCAAIEAKRLKPGTDSDLTRRAS